MARWRLMQPHYLNVPGTEWEYKETTSTGKQGRKMFQVPTYLNPNDGSDHNYPGEIIVCYAGKGHPKDIEFVGPPTPDMEPLDDEAQAINAELAPSWTHPIDALPGNGYSQSILRDFERQMAAAETRPNVSTSGVSQEKFDELQAQVKALMEQNAALKQSAPATRRA